MFSGLVKKTNPSIIVLIPCLNEAPSIGKVVRDFQAELPEAQILVIDNNSTDDTAAIARSAGATVLSEKRRGKGYVIQSMFQMVDADIYIMVDGDDTYPAEKARVLLDPVLNDQADMTIGSRIAGENSLGFKFINLAGNILFQNLINFIFGTQLTDILSGFRCMNRRIVKGLPLFQTGFEIEAEITIKSLARGFRLVEIPIDLRARQEGSRSKIRVVRDGFRILATIFALFRDYKPLTFFGSLGLVFILVGIIAGLSIVLGDLPDGTMLPIALAILTAVTITIGLLSMAVGLVLHTIDRRFSEMEYYIRVITEKTH